MKSTISILLAFLSVTVLIFGCSKDSDNKPEDVSNSGSMSYLNESYSLNKARITAIDQLDGTYKYSVAIYANDVQWNGSSFSKGHYLSFDLFCNKSGTPESGTYSESFDVDYIHMTANSSYFMTINDEYPYSNYEMIHTNIVVKQTGTTWEFTASGKDGVDRPFTASYKGSLEK